jgi:hypothetical protein
MHIVAMVLELKMDGGELWRWFNICYHNLPG